MIMCITILSITDVHSQKVLNPQKICNMKEKPLIMAHRMSPLPVGYAENSLITLSYNIKHYKNVIQEIDIHITSDGKAILMHDDTLDRTSTGKGKISNTSYEKIQTLHLKDSKGHVLNDKIPLLIDALKMAKGKVMLMLDMKPGTDSKYMMDIVKQTKTEKQVIVICYSVEDGVKMHKLYPKLVLALGFNTPDGIKKIKNSGLPVKQLIALIPRNASENLLQSVLNMKVPISYSAQNGIDLDKEPQLSYKFIAKKGISILCTDSLNNALNAF